MRPERKDMMLDVLIPVYNERETIEEIIRRVDAVGIEKKIIVVDDCSTDGTRDILRRIEGYYPNVKVVYHEKNRGKGAAIRNGINHLSGDIVIIQDADLEYDPSEYHKLIKPIVEGKADVVYGSRISGGEEHRVLYFWHYAGNRLLTLFSNIFTNLNLTDMETGYKVFKTEVLKGIKLEQDRFGFEPEVTARVAKAGYRIYEVGISYSGRTYAEGKKSRGETAFRLCGI